MRMNILIALGTFTFLGGVNAKADPSCKVGLESFQRTLYPFLRQNCVECHSGLPTDVENGPPHSSEDPSLAYDTLKKTINFSDLPSSKLIRYVQKKHWLNYDPSARGATNEEIIPLVQNWWRQGESSCKNYFSFISPLVALASVLPDMNSNPAMIVFSIQNPLVLTGKCQLSIEVRQFIMATATTPGAYLVKNPTLSCDSVENFRISSFRFLVNGTTEAFENIYDNISAEIRDSTSTMKTLLSDEELILIQRTPADSLSLAIQKFERL